VNTFFNLCIKYLENNLEKIKGKYLWEDYILERNWNEIAKFQKYHKFLDLHQTRGKSTDPD
jgi:hypothetical protein